MNKHRPCSTALQLANVVVSPAQECRIEQYVTFVCYVRIEFVCLSLASWLGHSVVTETVQHRVLGEKLYQPQIVLS